MREATCRQCGVRVEARPSGPLPTRCEDCNREHVRQQEQVRRERLVEGRAGRQPHCLGCGVALPYSGKGRPRERCAPCLAEWHRTEGTRRSRQWIEADRERAREKDRKGYWRRAEKVRQAKLDDHLRRNYGLERADYNRMVAEQDGRCLICKRLPIGSGKGVLAVDHCHSTGRVRGLLCGNCNTMIGLAGEDPAVLLGAVEYLTREYA